MKKALAIDANVLVLLTVGLTNISYIERHRRLHPTYRRDHFKFLQEILYGEPALATTPHALAEASNLARLCGEPMRTEVTNTLGRVIAKVEEFPASSLEAAHAAEFPRLGLTDAAFFQLDPQCFRVLSADIDLILALQPKGFEVLNFQHLIFGA